MSAEPKQTEVNGTPTHYSVGAIITNDEGKILMIDRLKQPFGFACPAGHIDEGEHEWAAVQREVKEETGLDPYFVELVSVDMTNKPEGTCSRGVSNHEWFLFKVKCKGIVEHNPAECKSIGWYSPEEIKTLTLEPVWKFWLTRLNII